MANGYDGDVQLSVGLSLEDAKDQAQKLSSEVSKIFNNIDTSKLDSKIQKYLGNMSKTQSQIQKVGLEIAKLQDKMQEASDAAQDYEQTEQAIKNVRNSLLEAYDAKKKLAEEGFGVNTEEMQKAKTDIDQLNRQLQILEQHKKELDESDLFVSEEDMIKLDTLKNQMGDLNNTVAQQIAGLKQLGLSGSESFEQISESSGQLNPKIADAVTRFKELQTAIEETKLKMQQLEQAGAGIGHEEYDKLTAQLGKMEREYDACGKKIQEYRDKLSGTSSVIQGASGNFSALSGSVSKVISTISRLIGLGPVIDGVKNKIHSFTSSLTGGSSAMSKFGQSVSKMAQKFILAGVEIVSITSLVNKIKSAISSGITTIAKMNSGMNSTNVAMTQLTSSLNMLKGALASAFVPILTTVSPILSSFMQQLANVINFIGMFIAKLTGAKSYMRATFKSTDYASSAGGGGGNKGKTAQEKYEEAVKKAQEKYDKQVAKVTEKNANAQAKAEEKQAKAAKKLAEQQEKANKQLAGFDELNVLATEDMEELEDVQADVYDMPELELPNLEDFTGSGGGGGADPFGLEEVALDGLEWNWDELKAKAEQLGRDLADILNKVFGNEDLARDIGHNIAEALNTALHFAYGFIDELDWFQLGRWFGTLIQEGIETFEWDLLGTTIGELCNGIAESIIGFFERYKAGTLGASLATMFNNAIKELNPDEIGEAIGDIIAAPIVEITKFIKEADIEEATRKVFEIFKTILTAPLLDTDKTLGYIVGEALATLINAAFEIVMGADVSGAIAAVKQFITDIFVGAIENVNFISYVEAVAIYCLEQAEKVYDHIILYIRGILNVLTFVPGEIGNLARQGVEALDSVNTKFDEAKQSVHDLADTYRTEIPNSLAEVKDSVLESSGYIKIQNDEVIKDLQDTSEELALKSHSVSERIKSDADATSDKLTTTADDGKEHINSLTDVLNTSKDAITGFSTSSATALDEVDAKTGEVSLNFGRMTSEVQSQLDAVNGILQTWYDNMIQTYFSQESWGTMLTEGITTALTTFFTGEFATTWDTQMQTWWDTYVKKWFDSAKWQTEIYGPWLVYTQTEWATLMSWFSSMMNSWWDNYVVPWFTKTKWQTLFNVILSAARIVMPQVRDEFSEKINEAADVVVEACGRMIEAIGEVLEMLSEAVELAGQLSELASSAAAGVSAGGGTVRTAGGSSGGGGVSHSSKFMPAIEIMHFEDNLGMSAFKFPELATGAVIPPNREFLAVLGDQSSGTNVEAPLDTIKQALTEAISDLTGSMSQGDTVIQIDGYEIFRAVRNQSDIFRSSTGYGAL